MFGVRRTTICKEGWYYLLVVLFILGGAALREVNLLVVLAGMLIAPAVYNWRSVSVSLRSLIVRRKLRRTICAGDLLTVELETENPRRGLGSWAIAVQDELRREPTEKTPERVELLYPHVGPGEKQSVQYQSRISRRGRYHVGPVTLSTRFPLGLVRCQVTFDEQSEVVVLPKLGHLTRRWLEVLESPHPGARASLQQQGHIDGDYYGLREWRSGDSRRWIHWRTSARLNELAVKQFEQQTRRDIVMLLDLWMPDNPTDEQRGQLELAVSFAATAIDDMGRTGGRHIRLSVVGEEWDHWSGPSSKMFTQRVLEELAVVRAGNATDLNQALTDLDRRQNSAAEIIVISTRGRRDATPEDASGSERRPHSRRLRWIDVRGEQRSQYFTLDQETN